MLNLREFTTSTPTWLKDAHDLMQEEYVEMYGESDQDPDNNIFGGDSIFGLREDNVGAGFIAVSRWNPRDAKVRALYVHPDFRKRGYASLLLGVAEWYAANTLGCSYMKFETGPKQQNAVRLYQRHGYSILSEGFGYYKDAEGSTFLGRRIG